ncbi:MAG TPA: sulfotransferase [Nocardioidaceae bacterium]|nr:sulfotransferase [Nocardioidaceae bacterium]
MTPIANQQQSRILLVAGWGRCGSTLLAMMFGQVPGMFSAGEVREIWLRGCVENRPCGCGHYFRDCPFWHAVGERAYGGWDRLDLKSVLDLRYSVDRPWGMPRVLARGMHGIEAYEHALAALYRAILDVSGCQVIVDSSKLPSHTLILARMPEVDLRMVHLVRDSRGVAYSTSKRVEKPTGLGPPTLLPRYGPVSSAARYDFYNGVTSALRATGVPYLRLRYEDLIADPYHRLCEVLAHAGQSLEPELPFLKGHQAELAENHLVDGNSVRFAHGPMQLRPDNEWRQVMPSLSRRTVTALTLPLLAAYGYRLVGRGRHRSA